MQSSFKWGIIGPGRIAKKFADCVHQLPGANIQAVASQSSQDLNRLKKEMHAHFAFNSYEDMLKHANLDAVYVATPHRFHYENTRLCLNSGFPVLVEKAFTVNSREAEALINEARSKKLFIMEAMWTRFLPVFQQVKQWLSDGKIGDVQLVCSTLGFKTERLPEDRLLNAELAGGTILDLGVYNIAASQFVFQKPPVSLSVQGYIGKTGVDESVSVSMHYGDGALSQFACTFLTAPLTQIEIYGSLGNIQIHPLFYQSEKATLTIGGISQTYENALEINGFEYEILEAQRCIQAHEVESPLMTHENTLDNMRVMDQIREMIGLKYPFE